MTILQGHLSHIENGKFGNVQHMLMKQAQEDKAGTSILVTSQLSRSQHKQRLQASHALHNELKNIMSRWHLPRSQLQTILEEPGPTSKVIFKCDEQDGSRTFMDCLQRESPECQQLSKLQKPLGWEHGMDLGAFDCGQELLRQNLVFLPHRKGGRF